MIPAETRGRLREWNRRSAAHYAAVELGFKRLSHFPALGAFLKRGALAHSRQRALAELQAVLGPGAILERLQLSPTPLAIWVVLCPRTSVSIPRSAEPRDLQPCVCTNYVVIGRLPDGRNHFGEGLWSLEMTRHALVRLLQRDPGADIAATVVEAHRRLLAAPADMLRTETMLVRAGRGYAVAEPRTGWDKSVNEPNFHFKLRTWLHASQVSQDDERASIAAAGPDQPTLGDTCLLPNPIRAIDLTRHAAAGPTPIVFKPLLPLPKRVAA